MKAVVLGVGRMGAAITWAAKELGFDVVCADINEDAYKNVIEALFGDEYDIDVYHIKDLEKDMSGIDSEFRPDVVISSLPYHQTEIAARYCIDNGLRYCDLGGRVDVSHRINEYAKEKATKPVMTDLGLAPGWVNILAEQGCRDIHKPVNAVKMMVGGLPSAKINHPLDYVVTWSVDGLINEYRDDCEVLEDGKIKMVAGMSGLETIDCGVLGKLEAFYTSGGASHTIQSMKKRGVRNCCYKTLRYEGHRDIVRFLMENQSEECVREAFERGCKQASGVSDIVLVKAFVSSEDIQWKKEFCVVGDSNQFSAMQKATAFPITAVASLMAEGHFDKNMEQRRDYWVQYPKNLSYEHVPYEIFFNRLKALGI
jgi:saccharopine dehydrogenase-like NADP-dependent oxidoreductase